MPSCAAGFNLSIVRERAFLLILQATVSDTITGSYEGWIYFKSDNSFSLYENGEYNSNHYDVSLNELDLLQERVDKKDKELG